MPVVMREDVSLISLFSRCRTYRVLPKNGSLLEQTNEVIEIFDVLNGVIEEKKAEQLEEQKSNMEKERLKRELK
jgi:hypothetical protein